MHPANQALRGVLELVGLAAIGFWGWTLGEGAMRYLLAIGLPIVVGAVWATFRVPNDPGPAPIAVPGVVRLLLEVLVFALATYGFVDTGYFWTAVSFLGITTAHYVGDWRRVRRLALGHE